MYGSEVQCRYVQKCYMLSNKSNKKMFYLLTPGSAHSVSIGARVVLRVAGGPVGGAARHRDGRGLQRAGGLRAAEPRRVRGGRGLQDVRAGVVAG